MKTFGLLSLASLCSAVALVSPTGCSQVCTEVACTTGITATVAVGNVPGLQGMQGTHLEACREGVCANGFISAHDDGELFCEMAERDDFFASCSVSAENVVSFQLYLRTEEVEDEEHYRFSVHPVAGDDATVEGAVEIEKTEINGSGCGYCYAGSL